MLRVKNWTGYSQPPWLITSTSVKGCFAADFIPLFFLSKLLDTFTRYSPFNVRRSHRVRVKTLTAFSSSNLQILCYTTGLQSISHASFTTWSQWPHLIYTLHGRIPKNYELWYNIIITEINCISPQCMTIINIKNQIFFPVICNVSAEINMFTDCTNCQRKFLHPAPSFCSLHSHSFCFLTPPPPLHAIPYSFNNVFCKNTEGKENRMQRPAQQAVSLTHTLIRVCIHTQTKQATPTCKLNSLSAAKHPMALKLQAWSLLQALTM